MRTIVTGSLAIDTISYFNGVFTNTLKSEKSINVTFPISDMHKDFGGCAGNIAYAMKLLGADPFIWAALGADGKPYLDRLKSLGIDTSGIATFSETFSAQANITTDKNASQIATFFGGAMDLSHKLVFPEINAQFAILSPGGKIAMPIHAKLFKEKKLKMLFDPGQAISLFSASQLLELASGSYALLLSKYEANLFFEITKTRPQEANSDFTIITKGKNGVDVFGPSLTFTHIQSHPSAEIDPVGAGDAFRGGLLFGLEKGLTVTEAARIGALMGAKKVQSRGAQNYTTSLKEISELHYKTYGFALRLD